MVGLERGEVDNVVYVGDDGGNVDLPFEAMAVIGPLEVPANELGSGAVIDGVGNDAFGIGTASERLGIYVGHDVQVGIKAVVISHRRDIDYTKAFDQAWPLTGQGHGRLAAHGMSDDGDGAGELSFNQFRHVAGHERIVHGIVPRGRSVVSKIKGKDPVRFAQGLGDGCPISTHTE